MSRSPSKEECRTGKINHLCRPLIRPNPQYGYKEIGDLENAHLAPKIEVGHPIHRRLRSLNRNHRDFSASEFVVKQQRVRGIVGSDSPFGSKPRP